MVRTQGVADYSPIRVDSLEPMFERMDASASAPLAAQWRELIARRPLLYLRVRAAAFRWVLLTPEPAACGLVFTGVDGPPEEMAAAGLRPRKSATDNALDGYATAFTSTPAFSHAAFGLTGLLLLFVLLRRRRPVDIAVAAMLGGGLAFAASFAVISIACDYRYLYDLDLAVIAAALYLAGGLHRDAS
jgi:MYXO-CTERM domain-containing protein